MSFREPMAHVRYGKNTELAGATPGVVRPMSTREADKAYRKAWRKNNPAWIRACGASLRKSAEPAPPESGTRKKRVEHSTRFRPLKRAKRQKKRLGKKFEKGVVNPFFI